ncbi:hypothetical protein [Cupriavidus lacunae]|uniref:hypothetical protein n=1 Tax=Cupriavidus lacunae TaxID=2666307 RepID=UPI001FC97993|nr:hypothetical protein [Cupriavidus lacunae]
MQQQLRSLLGHEQIITQAYGRHLLIKRLDDEEPTVVARLTELGRNRYGAAFRNHSGRWEPLPGEGPLDEMAELIVTLLQPYLQPDNEKSYLRDVVLVPCPHVSPLCTWGNASTPAVSLSTGKIGMPERAFPMRTAPD